MRTFEVVIVLALFSFFLVGCTHRSVREEGTTPTVMPESPSQVAFTPLTARFRIYTNGTLRTFNNAMYLNQSDTAYLTAADSTVIHVDQPGVTWGDFFATLPFKVTAECLTTGTGQQFCSSEQSELQFYLNGEVKLDVLNQEIQQDDYLEIKFGPRD